MEHEEGRSKSDNRAKRELCFFCKGSHSLETCNQFLKKSLSERRQFIRARGLCHGCLRWGHLRRDCRRKKSCTTCNGPHPTLLHDESLVEHRQGTGETIAEATSHRVEASSSKKHTECFSHSLIVPVWLNHEGNPQLAHLAPITEKLMPYREDIEVGLLIGTNRSYS